MGARHRHIRHASQALIVPVIPGRRLFANPAYKPNALVQAIAPF
jgi:hypothetical protein